MLHEFELLLKFFHLCERLKTEKRHGKTSDGERDRVAAHSWRMAMMVMLFSPYLNRKFDVLKAIKMAIIHDLPEILTGDQAYFHHAFDLVAKNAKQEREKMAILQLVSMLPDRDKIEMENVWNEYDQQSSYEAKIVKAIDKIEAQIQHNEADISVWNEFDRQYYRTYLDKFCDFDISLREFKMLIQEESDDKLKGI